MPNLGKTYNAPQAADYLGYSLSTLYKLTHYNKIKYSKPNGGQLKFRKKWLDDFIDSGAKKTQDELAAEAAEYVMT